MRPIGTWQSEPVEGAVVVTSTSRRSSEVTPFDLRERTSKTHVYFKPKIVDNDRNAANRLEGDLVYECKRPTDESFPTECGERATTKSSVSPRGALSISLNTSETRALLDGLQRLYSLSSSFEGIPSGETSFVEVNRNLKTALSIVQENLPTLSMLEDPETLELVKNLLRLLARGLTREQLSSALNDLEEGSLQQLSNGLNLEIMERAVNDIEMHISDQKVAESYWQDEVFAKYPWIISQVFATPCALIKSKAYVGGTTVDGNGASFVDFLYKSELTRDVLLIEIKKPTTKLLSSEGYRSNSYRISTELSGALSQVLSYRQTIMVESRDVVAKSGFKFEVIAPKCAIVIGNTNELLDDDGVLNPSKRDTFENFRNCLNGVTVITYDELLQKVKNLVEILRLPAEIIGDTQQLPAQTAKPEPYVSSYDNETPF